MLPDCREILLDEADGALTVTLNRPHKRNAMNAALVAEIMAVFSAIADNRDIRAVVLRGAGGNFCAGGDISDMNISSKEPEARAQIMRDFNRSFGHMITQVNSAPQVVITLLEGAVLGGGFGLACISDVAIADRRASFSLPETSLGLIPAQIAPFVVSRIGLTQARRLALLGLRIDGEQAGRLGIVHSVSRDADDMQAQLDATLKSIKRCAPGANAATKQLLLQVGEKEHEALLDHAADLFASALLSNEGREGTQAFMEKRKPDWAE